MQATLTPLGDHLHFPQYVVKKIQEQGGGRLVMLICEF